MGLIQLFCNAPLSLMTNRQATLTRGPVHDNQNFLVLLNRIDISSTQSQPYGNGRVTATTAPAALAQQRRQQYTEQLSKQIHIRCWLVGGCNMKLSQMIVHAYAR